MHAVCIYIYVYIYIHSWFLFIYLKHASNWFIRLFVYLFVRVWVSQCSEQKSESHVWWHRDSWINFSLPFTRCPWVAMELARVQRSRSQAILEWATQVQFSCERISWRECNRISVGRRVTLQQGINLLTRDAGWASQGVYTMDVKFPLLVVGCAERHVWLGSRHPNWFMVWAALSLTVSAVPVIFACQVKITPWLQTSHVHWFFQMSQHYPIYPSPKQDIKRSSHWKRTVFFDGELDCPSGPPLVRNSEVGLQFASDSAEPTALQAGSDCAEDADTSNLPHDCGIVVFDACGLFFSLIFGHWNN